MNVSAGALPLMGRELAVAPLDPAGIMLIVEVCSALVLVRTAFTEHEDV